MPNDNSLRPPTIHLGYLPAELLRFRLPVWLFNFGVFLCKPTPQIADLHNSFHLRQHFANVLGIHNERITVLHWAHDADQAHGST